MEPHHQLSLIRLEQVLKIIPVSKSTWYAGISQGKFPKPIKLGPRTAAYRVEDIAALIEKFSVQGAQEAVELHDAESTEK